MPDAELTDAELVAAAVDMLDEESHRYVERFVPCPRGCRFDYVDGRQVRVAGEGGEAGCVECFYGTVEDENAEHLDPFIEQLRGLAERLRRAARETAALGVEGWPGHMTCSEAESLAAVLTAVGAGQLAGELVANHAEADEDGDLHADVSGGDTTPAPS